MCTHCGGQDLTRLFSSFILGKGESYKRKGVYEDILSDSNLIRGMRQNDSRALAEWNRRMTQVMDEEPSSEFDDMVGRLEAGEPAHEVVENTMEVE